MARLNHDRINRCVRQLWMTSARLATTGVRYIRSALWCRQHPVRVEVLIADRARRRDLEHELRCGVRQLQRVLGSAFPADLAVVVQCVIATDRQLAGRYQVGQRPDGKRFALAWLALQVGDQHVSADELLAMLAELCISLATHELRGPSVLVPVAFESTQPSDHRRANGFQPDPLSPNRGSAGSIEHSA